MNYTEERKYRSSKRKIFVPVARIERRDDEAAELNVTARASSGSDSERRKKTFAEAVMTHCTFYRYMFRRNILRLVNYSAVVLLRPKPNHLLLLLHTDRRFKVSLISLSWWFKCKSRSRSVVEVIYCWEKKRVHMVWSPLRIRLL